MVLGLIDEIAAPDPARIFKRPLREAGVVLKDAETLIAEGCAHACVGLIFEADVVEECELGSHGIGALRASRRGGIDVIVVDRTALDIVETQDAGEIGSPRVEATEDSALFASAAEHPLAHDAPALSRAVKSESARPPEIGRGEAPRIGVLGREDRDLAKAPKRACA